MASGAVLATGTAGPAGDALGGASAIGFCAVGSGVPCPTGDGGEAGLADSMRDSGADRRGDPSGSALEAAAGGAGRALGASIGWRESGTSVPGGATGAAGGSVTLADTAGVAVATVATGMTGTVVAARATGATAIGMAGSSVPSFAALLLALPGRAGAADAAFSGAAGIAASTGATAIACAGMLCGGSGIGAVAVGVVVGPGAGADAGVTVVPAASALPPARTVDGGSTVSRLASSIGEAKVVATGTARGAAAWMRGLAATTPAGGTGAALAAGASGAAAAGVSVVAATAGVVATLVAVAFDATALPSSRAGAAAVVPGAPWRVGNGAATREPSVETRGAASSVGARSVAIFGAEGAVIANPAELGFSTRSPTDGVLDGRAGTVAGDATVPNGAVTPSDTVGAVPNAPIKDGAGGFGVAAACAVVSVVADALPSRASVVNAIAPVSLVAVDNGSTGEAVAAAGTLSETRSPRVAAKSCATPLGRPIAPGNPAIPLPTICMQFLSRRGLHSIIGGSQRERAQLTVPSARMRARAWISFCDSTTVEGRTRSMIERTNGRTLGLVSRHGISPLSASRS
ncbi:hypothetical protein D9M73_100500 [compost metagenome]